MINLNIKIENNNKIHDHIKLFFVLIYRLHLFLGYRSNDYQWRHGYNSAGSSQMRGPWNSGFRLPARSLAPYPTPPPIQNREEYQQRNHYSGHQSRNISHYQGVQQNYPNQRVCFFKYIIKYNCRRFTIKNKDKFLI